MINLSIDTLLMLVLVVLALAGVVAWCITNKKEREYQERYLDECNKRADQLSRK